MASRSIWPRSGLQSESGTIASLRWRSAWASTRRSKDIHRWPSVLSRLLRLNWPGPTRLSRTQADALSRTRSSGSDHGTGAGVRVRGFKLPAAGKSGTSRDGWFAGYTKDLLVISWVGFDDNRDLNLEGARSALPIWTDFDEGL